MNAGARLPVARSPFAIAYHDWMRDRDLHHRELAAVLGISKRTSEAYSAGRCLPAEDVLATLLRLGFAPPPFVRRGPGRPEVHL